MVYCRTASGVLLKRLINNASNGGRLRIFDFYPDRREPPEAPAA